MNEVLRIIPAGARRVCALLLGLFLLQSAVAGPPAGTFDDTLRDIQHRWAEVSYGLSGKAQKTAFDMLLEDARALALSNPGRAEPLIWQGIVASSCAGVKGPFGAMSLAKEAKRALESAQALDPGALQGSAYTSLGVLYYKVPGGLLGFGDDDTARRYLEKALEMNPDGIDPNYFYGEFLFEQKQYEQARDALLRASEASPRSGRALADSGRRREIARLLERVDAKLGRSS